MASFLHAKDCAHFGFGLSINTITAGHTLAFYSGRVGLPKAAKVEGYAMACLHICSTLPHRRVRAICEQAVTGSDAVHPSHPWPLIITGHHGIWRRSNLSSPIVADCLWPGNINNSSPESQSLPRSLLHQIPRPSSMHSSWGVGENDSPSHPYRASNVRPQIDCWDTIYGTRPRTIISRLPPARPGLFLRKVRGDAQSTRQEQGRGFISADSTLHQQAILKCHFAWSTARIKVDSAHLRLGGWPMQFQSPILHHFFSSSDGAYSSIRP
ncbi:hypothetical protein V8F20_012273 [Naviculisporaceae sp. PSN 640]